MALGDRLKKLIAGQLEGQGGAVMVLAKNFIVQYGCDHLDEAMTFAKDKWAKAVEVFDVPWVPESVEQWAGDLIWTRVEKGIRAFAAKVCVPVPVAPSVGSPAPGEEVFRGPNELMGDSEVMKMANDPTLPPA